MVTDKTEEELWKEQIEKVALLITNSLVQVILDDDFEDPVPEHTSVLTGDLYYHEVMDNPNVHNFRHVTRMDKTTFLRLLHILKTEGNLSEGRIISAGEKIFILTRVLTAQTTKEVAERFQHSKSTIHDCVYETIVSTLRCKEYFMRQPELGDPIHDRILKNPKYFPFFRNAVGCLDGTHVPAVVPVKFQDVFRNRKGWLSQNVLGVVDFDMMFTYILAGWEGQAHDGRVLSDAWSKGLQCPKGKYYLADAGYALSWETLTPYRGVRYHLKEWSLTTDSPQTKEELFNYRHAQLRNVVERVYGVAEKRYPILTRMQKWPIDTQSNLVMVVSMWHNFIRRNTIFEEPEFYEDLPDRNEFVTPGNHTPIPCTGRDDIAALNAWRDGIAQEMWDSYQAYKATRANV